MTVHVGEVDSQVEVAPAPAGGGGGGGGAPSPDSAPSWQDQERHKALCRAQDIAWSRTAGGGFDA